MAMIFDELTIIAIVSAVCITLLTLVLMDCCKLRKGLHKLFSSS